MVIHALVSVQLVCGFVTENSMIYVTTGDTSNTAVQLTSILWQPGLNLMKLLGAYLGAWLSLVNGVGYLSMSLKVNRLGSGWTTNDLN